MGLTCSVLGHDYGEPASEREREEHGSEVLLTVREVETCARCGHARTVAERTEVAPRSAAATDRRPGQPGEGSPAGAGAGPGPYESAPDAGSRDGAASVDVSPSAPSRNAPPRDVPNGPAGRSGPGTGDTDPEPGPTSGGTGGARVRGRTGNSAPSGPETDGTTTGGGIGAAERAGETGATGGSGGPGGGLDRIDPPAGADDAAPSDVRAPGEWPAAAEDAGADDGRPDEAPTTDTHEGTALESWALGLDEPEPGDDADGSTTDRGATDGTRTPADGTDVLRCPACGLSMQALESSFRAGDICPDCRGGYLANETRKG